jgi:hypothetical protein
MTELWYYAEGEETRETLSLSELLPLLGRIADPRRVMIWRQGFDDWKAVEEVREVAAQLVRPPPLRSTPPSVPVPPSAPITPAIREPVVAAEDAAEFKDLKPEPSGIGGWLGLLAFSQIVGILRLVVSLGQYYAKIDPEVWAKFPTAIWSEAALNAAMIWLCVYSTVLLFRHSRKFPRVFIWQMVFVIFMPIVDLLLIASVISLATSQPIGNLLTIEPKVVGQMIAGGIGALIWIPYVLRSRRVANTFTR